MFSEDGHLVWAAQYRTWGGLKHIWKAENDNDAIRGPYPPVSRGALAIQYETVEAISAQDCPIRFQGQWEDAETGLYYNRYRYYDPLVGQYMCPDPLGLGGGTRPQGYVHNPNAWIDPFGLANYPVPDTAKAANGLDYRSNPKHTLGGEGNSLKAGIEPSNSLELFGNSVLGKNGNRYALDANGNVHRFAPTNDGSWHWNGSVGQTAPRPNLTSAQVGNDIIRYFNLPRKGW